MREKLIECARQAMWSPASGPVSWTPQKIEATGRQAERLIDAILAELRDALPDLYLTIREASIGAHPETGEPMPLWDWWECPGNSAEDKGYWKAVTGHEPYHASYDWPEWQEAILTAAHRATIDHIRSGK